MGKQKSLKSKKFLSISINAETLTRLRKMALAQDRSVSALLRRMIERCIVEQESREE